MKTKKGFIIFLLDLIVVIAFLIFAFREIFRDKERLAAMVRVLKQIFGL